MYQIWFPCVHIPLPKLIVKKLATCDHYERSWMPPNGRGVANQISQICAVHKTFNLFQYSCLRKIDVSDPQHLHYTRHIGNVCLVCTV